ncbi:hypothetical protein NQ318_023436, partial [Aromia moschata]
MAVYIRYFRFQNLVTSNIKCSQTLLSSTKKSFIVYKKRATSFIPNLQYYAEFHTSCLLKKRRKTAEERKSQKIIEYSPKPKTPIVDVWRNITLAELASVLNKDVWYVHELFFNQFKNPNTPITDFQVLQEAIRRSGHRMRIIGKPKASIEEDTREKDALPRPPPRKEELKPRPPVVTVMGHVDHGKTTLLDALRHSNVVDQEFGGITQHIGAFSVLLDSGARITFLDTPGHAAFSAMRARGANVTDIVVLVVAADDGVMEQTLESVRMARQANVPIVVAINKIDSSKADIERTVRMLMEIGIQVEKLGGDVQAIPISALKKTNLPQLVEAITLQAELLEVGGDPTGPVEAVVVESKAHQHRGKLCTVVVQRGTLKRGKILVAGTAMAKVRMLRDAEGKPVDYVGPGYPAEVEGWKDLPPAGEQVLQVESERRAKEVLRLIDDIKEEINARLPEKEVEEISGEATVLQQFEISQGNKKIPVAGCRCIKGSLKRSGFFKVVRNGEVIHT